MKRNMKKMLSLFMALTMLAGMLTFMSVSVSAGTVVLEDNFDRYASAEEALSAGWMKYSNSGLQPDGIEQVDAEHGKSMKIVSKQYHNKYMLATGTTGKYRLETSMYLQENDTLWEDAYLVAFFSGTENILAEFGRADADRNIGGPIKIGGVDTGKRFSSNTWYDIIADIDLDNGAYNVTISDANGTVESGNGSFTANSSIQAVVFRSWQGNNTYIDNVRLKMVEENDKWVEDFEWENATDYKIHGWQQGNSLGDPTLELSTIDEEHGKSLKMAQTTSQYSYPLGKTSGTWKLSASVYPGAINQQVMVKFGSVPYGDPAGATANTATMNNLFWFWTGGNIYLTAGNDIIPRNFAGNYEANKWYDISAIIDLDKGLYKVTVKNDDTVIGERVLILDKNVDLSYVTFTSWAGANSNCYLDNISLEPSTEIISNVIVYDDFEKYTGVTITNSAYSTTNLYNNGWAPGLSNWSVDSTNLAPEINSTDFESQVLAVGNTTQNTQGVSFELSNPITEGKVKVSYKLNNPGTKRMGFILKDLYTWTDSEQETIYGGLPSAKNSLSGPSINEQEKFFDLTVDEWYDIENTFDMDNKSVSVRILKDGKTVGLKKDIPLTKVSQLSVITLYGWDDKSAYYIDDFKVELIDDAETTYDYLIEENDFQDVSYYASLENTAYSFAPRAGVSYEIAQEGTNKFFKLTGTASRIAKTLAGAKTGKLRFTYDIKTDGIAVITYVGVNSNNAGKNQVLLGYIHSNGMATHTYTAETDYQFFAYEADSWITMENVIDLDNKTVSYKAYDNAGNLLGSAVQDGLGWINLSEDEGDDIEGLNSFWVRNWGGEGTSVSVDNLKFEYYYGIPSMSESQISMTDISDNTVDLSAEKVTPGIKTITLDFGAELTADSVDGAIVLKEKDGTETYEGALSGEKYIFTLTSGLKEDTVYEITIDGKVATALGYELGKSFTYEFKTSSAKCVITADGIYDEAGTTKLVSVAGLTTDGKIYAKANAVNDKAVSETVTFIVAYYDSNNVLVETDIKPVEVAAGHSGSIGSQFTLPDMTGVTKISVFVWNNERDAVPYCASVSI